MSKKSTVNKGFARDKRTGKRVEFMSILHPYKAIFLIRNKEHEKFRAVPYMEFLKNFEVKAQQTTEHDFGATEVKR